MSESDAESTESVPNDESRSRDPDSVLPTPSQIGASTVDDATRAAGGAIERVRAEVDTRTTEAGSSLERIANDLRAVSGGLADQGEAQPARLASDAARHSDRLGAYLKQSDSDRLLADAEELIRRQPAAATATAALAGFVAARFLKASAYRRQRLRARQGGVGSAEALPAPGGDPAPAHTGASGEPAPHGGQ